MNLEHVFNADRARQQQIAELFREYTSASEVHPPDARPDALPETKPEGNYIPVNAGSIRVLHYVPAGVPAPVRPVVFLPGWGTIPEGFAEFLRVINGQAECYYVETREKNSSRLDRRRARMDMDQMAADVQVVMELAGPESVLMGTCWGSTIIAHGLARGIIAAKTVVLFDPMHELWFPKWLLNWVVPALPLWLWSILKPLGKRIALWGMKEPVQRARAELFIDSADLWKWKHTALQVRNVNLYESMAGIRQEVLVMNGVQDKIHDRRHYPELAALAPQGRFFYLPVDEALRERLLGIVAVMCARQAGPDGLPAELLQFERCLR